MDVPLLSWVLVRIIITFDVALFSVLFVSHGSLRNKKCDTILN